MAAFGYLLERVIVRPILGYPQFAIVMVTIGLGFLLRGGRRLHLGPRDDLRFETPFTNRVMQCRQA